MHTEWHWLPLSDWVLCSNKKILHSAAANNINVLTIVALSPMTVISGLLFI